MKKIGKVLKSKISKEPTLFGETKRKRTLNQEKIKTNQEKRDKPSLKLENIEKMTIAKKNSKKTNFKWKTNKKGLDSEKNQIADLISKKWLNQTAIEGFQSNISKL